MDSLKKESRVFGIKAFRNLGFNNDGTPTNEWLNLNYCLDKEYLGDLVILIGPNNAGKSNVLDALECFVKQNITDRDKSDNFMNDDQLKPSLSLINFVNSKPQQSWVLNVNNEVEFTDENGQKFAKSVFDIDKYTSIINATNAPTWYNRCTNYLQLLRNYGQAVDFNLTGCQQVLYQNGFQQVKYDIAKLQECLKLIYQKMMQLYEESVKTPNKVNKCLYIGAGITAKQILQILDRRNGPETVKFLDDYAHYLTTASKIPADIPSLPKIIRYQQQNISDKDLSCTPDDANKNDFFKSILKVINGDEGQINNAYTTAKRNNSDGILETTSDSLNKSLLKVAAYFNQLYCLDDNKYLFKIRLESNKVSFNIFREENDGTKVALVLNHQSTGFRWFFDFFFHVFASNDLKPGDIIIMDEPATNLHVKGQEELRKLLKKFAIDNAITFVIATHSPFLVDLDYLDEIRLICLQNNEVATIKDNFTTVNPDDADSLLAIRESLTVRNSILLDPKQIVVFVEGITDYNYFVAMKTINPLYKNIVFLPINGVGKDTDQKQKRLDELLKIRSLNCVVLTDGDEAGEEFSNLNEDNLNQLKLLKLTDVNPSFKEVENLFSNEDAIKFNVALKDSGISSTFKKIVIKHPKEISKDTYDNFNQVFLKIRNLITK